MIEQRDSGTGSGQLAPSAGQQSIRRAEAEQVPAGLGVEAFNVKRAVGGPEDEEAVLNENQLEPMKITNPGRNPYLRAGRRRFRCPDRPLRLRVHAIKVIGA
jgi:hypothetical protein